MSGKNKIVFFCSECGYESPKWIGKCPGCNSWNSFVEEKVTKANNSTQRGLEQSKPILLKDIEISENTRYLTGFNELDRVLGGGLVKGSLILLGGEPGIGKSTLILQMCNNLSEKLKGIYVSGEESAVQVKLRADRLGKVNENLLFLGEVNINEIENHIDNEKPDFVIIDSIQTIYNDEISSIPGSVSQVREVTAKLMILAKSKNISVILIGHVTKDGVIAGPRMLEHMVDTVLYLEGERFFTYRILRCVKNRFGSTNEIGVFEMKEIGLVEVKNISSIMLDESNQKEPGSVITAIQEGNSTILVEIQALATPTYFNMPRRISNGIDINRINLITAVLEKKCNLNLGNYDIYINVVGGLKITEPATDLAIAMAIVSSYKNKSILDSLIVTGELSLTGDIRHINLAQKRINEAEKLGYKNIVVPNKSVKGLKLNDSINVITIKNIYEAIEELIV